MNINIERNSHAHRYFLENVIPANIEWRKSQLDKRLAIILAGDLNNLAEYYWHSVKKEGNELPILKDFRKQLSSESESLSLIRDIADCQKHLFICRSDKRISSTEQVGRGSVGYGQAWGLCYGGGELLSVSLDTGNVKYFVVIVDDALSYWSRKLSIAITNNSLQARRS